MSTAGKAVKLFVNDGPSSKLFLFEVEYANIGMLSAGYYHDMPRNQLSLVSDVETRQFWTLIPKFLSMNLESLIPKFLSMNLDALIPKFFSMNLDALSELNSTLEMSAVLEIQLLPSSSLYHGNVVQWKVRKKTGKVDMVMDEGALLDVPVTNVVVCVFGNQNHHAARVGGCPLSATRAPLFRENFGTKGWVPLAPVGRDRGILLDSNYLSLLFLGSFMEKSKNMP
ncbi:hypothetical protein SLE2022_083010 [Rubroshorea leprosula]